MKCYLLVFSVLGSVLARNTCHYDKTLDPSSKTYLSPVVFLGKLTSLNHNENIVRTRFNVKRLFKNAGLASKQKKIHLEYRNATFCELPKHMELMKDYLVFMRVNYSDVEPLFLPEPVTRKMMKDVRKIACQNCAQPPSVRQLEDVFIKSGGRLKLHCRVDGNPLPSIQWFKNGKKIESKGRIKIKNKRKQSKLTIKTVRQKDSGEYECQASNVVQHETVSSKAIVMVIKNLTATATTKHMGIDMGIPCPVDTFCLNGGNCTFYEMFGEYVCNCAEGFMGQRCDHKSVPVLLGEVNPHLRHVTGFVP